MRKCYLCNLLCKMSINRASYSEMENDTVVPRVVELNALKSVTPENNLCQSTAFEASAVLTDPGEDPDTRSAISEGLSEKEASLTSMSTASSSSDVEEHRYLSQSSTPIYSSFCSTCSESDLSCSTLEGDSSYDSSFTTDVESSDWEEDYSDDDGHYNLIQLPISGDSLEFWPLSAEESSSSSDELESSPHGCKQQDTGQEHQEGVPEEHEVKEEEQSQEEQKFCLQCHAWPEVKDCRDPPRGFYEACHHTKIDSYECAFGTSVHLSTVSLSFIDENPIAVAKRKAMESVLSASFYTLIQQFAVNPEKVARTLYGISVIDITDLDIATAHVLPELERATVLAVTLVRRLRRWPDLFGDACKVLGDIPAMQEANAKVRRLLYEGFTEDQYSKILARSVPQHQLHSTGDVQHSSLTSTSDPNNPTNLDIGDTSPSSILLCSTANPDAESDENKSTSTNHDIIAEDSVSYTSKMSEGVDPDVMLNEKSDCACSKVNSGINFRLHESCLENRSIRSLDTLIADEELDIDARDKNGRTPLLVACLCLPSEKNSNLRISLKQRRKIRSLLVNGADSSIQDYDGNTALHIAALRRDQEVVKLLLDRSYTKQYFSIAVTNKNSRTALHYACYWGDLELVAPLLEFEKEAKSGLINVCDRNGDTGLHIASKGGFKAIIKELLKAKADKNIQNRDGKTAADVAEEANHNSIAKLLRRKKSRWLFPRKKSASYQDQPDGGLHRAPSNSSLLSAGSNQSDEVFHWSGEESAEEDTQEQDLY